VNLLVPAAVCLFRLIRSIRLIRIPNLLEPARAAVAVLRRGEGSKATTALEIRMERIERMRKRIASVRGDGFVRVESGVSLVGN
jgi:hypothetical protein